MKVLISGATGFIGRRLSADLAARGHAVVGLSRDADRARSTVESLASAFAWQPTAEPLPEAALDGVDAIVHLAGESVAGRWSRTQRQAIRDSRVTGTRNLVAGLRRAAGVPPVLISGSAIGYYGERGDDELGEDEPPGDDFLARVCVDWEAEARAAEEFGTRVVYLRTGIVLGAGGGALAEMMLPARLGLGGPLGSGRQWWSWIHMDDVVGLVAHLLDEPIAGAVNNTAPEPMRQKEFARTLGRVLRRPAFLPAPAFAIRAALGGFAAELLGSKRVIPARALTAGYDFRFPKLEAALRSVLGR